MFVGVTNGAAANPNISATKTGRACMKLVMGAWAWGDASIGTAMNAGGITKVATIDYNVHNVLGVYGEYCTIVHGQ